MNFEKLKRKTNQQGNEKKKQQDSSKNNANGAIINEDQQKGTASFLLRDGANPVLHGVMSDDSDEMPQKKKQRLDETSEQLDESNVARIRKLLKDFEVAYPFMSDDVDMIDENECKKPDDKEDKETDDYACEQNRMVVDKPDSSLSEDTNQDHHTKNDTQLEEIMAIRGA